MLELTHWTLVTAPNARRDIKLPERFSATDFAGGSHVVLETVVDTPPRWRGAPATLSIPVFFGSATLDANGTTVAARDIGVAHSWVIDRAATARAPLVLRLALNARFTPQLTTVPRLVTGEQLDSWSAFVSAFNFDAGVALVAFNTFLTVVYSILFALDRSRKAHGWYALTALAPIPYGAFLLGMPDGYVRVAGALLVSCGMLTCIALAAFMRSYFRRGALPRWLYVACVPVLATVPLTFVSGAGRISYIATALGSFGLLSYVLAFLIGEHRVGTDRVGAGLLAAGMGVVLLTQPFFGAPFTGLGGLPPLPGALMFGICGYSVMHVTILGRDHTRSLREAEARVKEVEQLNVELRHQVAERSRELTEALSRAEGSVSPAALDVGDVFDGRYRVTRALGRGGMGAVYEVERTRDGKKLALKVVTAALQAKQAARFAREAEIGARLQHENLVSIVDVGIAAGATPFLVMELVRGGSLEEKRARFGDAGWARPILRQIASGLDALHANSVVHRDLKPGNVLLLDNGAATPPVAKISDFGISRFGAPDDSADVDVEGATVTSGGARHASPRNLTETGALMGTPQFMPPEAWFGPAKHPSADVFSFGVLAYEALSGRSPFAVPAVLLVRSRQPIPTPAPLDGIDVGVASLVLACLRVEPSERPRAREIVDRL